MNEIAFFQCALKNRKKLVYFTAPKANQELIPMNKVRFALSTLAVYNSAQQLE